MKKCSAVAFIFTFFVLSITQVIAGNYDGQWQFTVKSNIGSNCSASAGSINVSDGKIRGTLKTEGTLQRISGNIAEDGSFKGRVGRGLAKFTGALSSYSGAGEWKNRFGCRGTVTIIR